jgi:transcriptional regulator with PAS, ATPase and Fis domain
VFNAVQDGLVSVDKDGKIDQLNPKAAELLGPAIPRGNPVDSVIPDFNFKHLMAEGRDSFGKVAELHGHRAVVNVTPIISQSRAEGAVVVLQEVGRIQDLEKRVRRQLFAKGLFAKYHFKDILAESPVMRHAMDLTRQYASTASNIVIYGETGTGKELLAQSIHNESLMRDGPFVAINCGALPPTLLESELFGYVEGAFTGAVKGGKAGLFELAHGGTIFLDEINELDFHLQTKLLRVLQEREVMRVGDTKVIPVSVRVFSGVERAPPGRGGRGAHPQGSLLPAECTGYQDSSTPGTVRRYPHPLQQVRGGLRGAER